jgi:hypothetical protein
MWVWVTAISPPLHTYTHTLNEHALYYSIPKTCADDFILRAIYIISRIGQLLV